MKRAHGWLISIGTLAGTLAATGCGGGQGTSSTAPESASPGDDEAMARHRAMGPQVDDEEDDDGVAIEGLGGRLDVYHIRQGLEPHEGKISDCHVSRQGRRRYIGGQVELAFVVNADGTVKSVRFLRSDLGAWPIERCLLEVGRGIVFPEPEGNGEADFTLPLSFSARGRVALWEQEQAQAEVGERMAELAACAAEAGTEEPGKVSITLYVGTRGQVQSVGFAAPDAALDDAWATCAESKIMAWSLSDPRGQVAKLHVVYPTPTPPPAQEAP